MTKGLIFFLLFMPLDTHAMSHRPAEPEFSSSVSSSSTSFFSLTLQECYELALKRSETVAIAKEDIEEAEAQFFIAASEAVGDIDFEMTRRRQDIQKGGGGDSVGGSLSDIDRRERKFIISQPLFQGFKALGALTGAGSLKSEQKEEWRRAQELLFLDVASAFYGLLREEKDLNTIRGIHDLFLERIRELGEREKIGRSRLSEVATAEARMRTLEAERARIEGTRAVAQYLLEFLTGISLEGRTLADEELPAPFAGELTPYLEDIEARSDVEAARQSAKTAWRGVIVAQADLWPEITMEHIQYERREGFQSNLDWDFLFKINVPLLQGGEIIGNVKEAVSLWKKEKLTYSETKRQAELEVKQGYAQWLSSVNRNRAFEEAVKASEENFRLQKEEYERNLVSNLDVLEALESLLETRREANEAHYEMKTNYWNLLTAAGELPDGKAVA